MRRGFFCGAVPTKDCANNRDVHWQ
jgi:hypothetical protein